jgi:ribonuclease Z
MGGYDERLEVWGPKGTADMMENLEKAFAFDVHNRRDVIEKFPGKGAEVLATDVEQGVVFDRGVSK